VNITSASPFLSDLERQNIQTVRLPKHHVVRGIPQLRPFEISTVRRCLVSQMEMNVGLDGTITPF
jgi:hypothetical protein